jgi:hypothetical protein
MSPIHVKNILTHEHPDIDAILSVLLLRKFGEERFPGAATAEVIFASAGELPNGKTPGELEKEGILAVDIGGGRFDTHPTGEQVHTAKRDRCAADLIAEALGVLDHPHWKAIIEYTRQQDTTGQGLHSTDFIHHLTALPTILTGFQMLYENDSSQILETGLRLLSVLPIYAEKKVKLQDLSFFFDLTKEMADRYFQYRSIDIEHPHGAYTLLAEWRKRLVSSPETAFSSIEFDQIVSLPALMIGFWHQSANNKQEVWEHIKPCFDAVIEREERWYQALEEFDREATVQELRKVRIVSIKSTNGMVIKAARFRKKADMIIYREPRSGATSILLNRQGPLKKFSLRDLAAKIRIADCVEAKERPDYHNVKELGMVHGWFLHQSENLLVRGSKKADQFIPSQLKMSVLLELAKNEVDWQIKIPDIFCPKESCTGEVCAFYRLQFPCCKNHRKNSEEPKTTFMLANKFPKSFWEKFKEE